MTIRLRAPLENQTMTHVCRICGNSLSNSVWEVREMMLGSAGTFTYFECASCGCLQIATLPPKIEQYYPREGYYSFSPVPTAGSKAQSYFKRARMDYILHRRNLLGWFVTRVKGTPLMLTLIAHTEANFSDSVLDVGSGAGHLLFELGECGFTNLTGIDPYIEKGITYSNGVRIIKGELQDLHEQYDLIMLHHSFEHMWDPRTTLKQLHRLLKPHRQVLIRIPTVSSFAWKKYREKWVQLDAPRHFYLHSKRSVELLAQQSGFKLRDVIYDSTGFQFWGSEQYIKGISLNDPKSVAVNKASPLFSSEELARFEREAAQLNKRGEGDMAAFYLVRV